MTAFMPQRKKPFEETLRELEEMEKERRDLERKLYLCRNSKRSERKGAESPRALEKKLTALYEQAEVMLKEVNRQTDCLKKGRRQYFSPDEKEQPYNECIGAAYGCAVFVRDDGALLYCEQQADLTVIGDTLQEEDLHSFDELPDGEQQLIIHALLKDPETPDFSKQILYRKGDRQYD